MELFIVQNEPGLISGAEILEQDKNSLPGVLGQWTDFIYKYSHYPDPTIALVGAITCFAGIVGRTYNTPGGAGLNIFSLLLAPTGAGKDIVGKARNHLFNEIAKDVPAIRDFAGPKDAASGQGLLRCLEKDPCCASIFKEFSYTLKRITAPNANSTDAGLGKVLLDTYSDSGHGSAIDPTVYSDITKNIGTIFEPAYSIFAESVPERIYDGLTDGMIASGLLPRFDVWETYSSRPYINRNRIKCPDASLVTTVGDIAKYCLEHSRKAAPPIVPTVTEGAIATLDRFERHATDCINAGTEIPRQLWNRAYLKVEKLATLRAVGENYLWPVITDEIVKWATNLVAAQTQNLIAKFESGNVGEEAGNEIKQLAHMKRIIAELFSGTIPHDKLANTYKVNYTLLNRGVIEHSYLHRRLATLPAFKPKPSLAIKSTINLMIDNEWLRHCPNEMKRELGTRAACYQITNLHEFADCECVSDKTAFIKQYLNLM